MTSPSKRICPTPTWNGYWLARCFARGSIRQPTPASAPRTVPQPVSSRSQIDLQPRPGPVPSREPMPPAVICHLSVAGTPTASWSSTLSGCQCLLRLSATLAPRALRPRPGSLPFSGANPSCGCLPPQRCRYSNHVLVHCPFREPMPPATVCHLTAACTPTASWFTALGRRPKTISRRDVSPRPRRRRGSLRSGAQPSSPAPFRRE